MKPGAKTRRFEFWAAISVTAALALFIGAGVVRSQTGEPPPAWEEKYRNYEAEVLENPSGAEANPTPAKTQGPAAETAAETPEAKPAGSTVSD